MTSSDLANLMQRVASQDRAAFAELYAATSAKLYGIALRILARRDIADEVIQDVYVRIWENAHTFDDGKGSPITWMAAIARNRALDEVRRVRPLSVEDTPAALEVPDGGLLPLASLEMSEDRRRLMDCLDRLEPQKKALVCEAYLSGDTREALAHRHGAPVATIKTWLHRSLKQLKDCLAT